MNKNVKLLSLLGALLAGSASASEWRSPWLSEHGPLRYTFEKLHQEKSNLNFWTAAHMKEAHKSFLKHGTDTQPLTALYFNKADIPLKEIFWMSQVPLASENYNPFLAIGTYSPRATYNECGVTMGGRWDYPVWNNKGRIGLRATVPFRRIEIEREDITDKNANPLNDVMVTLPEEQTVTTEGLLNVGSKFDVATKAWRADFVNAIAGANGTSIVNIPNTSTVNIAGSKINKATAATAGTGVEINGTTFAAAPSDATTGVGFIKIPRPIKVASWQLIAPSVTAGDATTLGNAPYADGPIVGGSDVAYNAATKSKALVIPNTGVLPSGVVGVLGTADYKTDANAVNNIFSIDNWLIFRTAQNGTGNNKLINNPTSGVSSTIEDLAQQYKINTLTFLANNDFEFESMTRSGLGDIDLDLFYEHTFNEDWIGELFLGVRVPTGGSHKLCGNPYRPQLGNSEHWEIKLGGLMAWQALSWLNVKADAAYSFAIEATENRPAAFKGAKIKNIGPCASAEVDWGYFTGHLDLTFFHPKTSDIRSTLGYEFYYKTEDHLTFKNKTAKSWLGKEKDTVTGSPTIGQFLATSDDKELSNDLARANTEAIAHKIRCETSYQANKWFELFAGASTTFAGQNVYRDRDVHVGFNIRY
jgi:hypothetical protein